MECWSSLPAREAHPMPMFLMAAPIPVWTCPVTWVRQRKASELRKAPEILADLIWERELRVCGVLWVCAVCGALCELGVLEVLGARAGSPGWASTAGRIGYCGQEVARTDLPLSVREVVDFGTIPRRLGHGDRARAVSAALESVGAGALARRLYRELSAGERQRVALARCLCQAADLLVLDEPLASLDPAGGTSFMELVESLGVPVVLVTHVESHFERPEWRVLELSGGTLADAA